MSRSKNNSKNTGKNAVRPYTVMCTDMYLLWILVVFPLYYADGYFHLPEKKAMFWTVSTLVYVIVCLVGVVITAFSMRENWSMENFKKNITMTDVFMFGFLISNLIALLMSDNPMGSWVGQNARYYGARVLILVCVVYFLVSRYAWINQVFIVAFLIGGNGVCLLATFDYFGMDVLGINKQMQKSDWLVFISTMGNANTCASYVTMAMAGALCFFCVAKSVKAKVFAGISIVNCSMALITARSDSAFVGIAVIIIVLGILAIIKKIDIKGFLLALIFMDIGIIVCIRIRSVFVDYLLDETVDDGISKVLIEQWMILVVILAILIIANVIISYIQKANIHISQKQKRMCIFTTVVIACIVIAFVGYKTNIIELFLNSMGVNIGFNAGSRAYIYQLTIESYTKLPLINKIFGCGHASISNILSTFFETELYRWGLSINSSHNNVLEYLIMLGMLGVICYLGAIICAIKQGFSIIKENDIVLVLVGCVIAYFAQGLFNIEQTNTTPIFWLMLSLCQGIYQQYIIKKK